MVVTLAQVEEMNYAQLKEECKKEGLSIKGKTELLRKRLQSHVQEAEQNAKRQKRCPSDDLICPVRGRYCWMHITTERECAQPHTFDCSFALPRLY